MLLFVRLLVFELWNISIVSIDFAGTLNSNWLKWKQCWLKISRQFAKFQLLIKKNSKFGCKNKKKLRSHVIGNHFYVIHAIESYLKCDWIHPDDTLLFLFFLLTDFEITFCVERKIEIENSKQHVFLIHFAKRELNVDVKDHFNFLTFFFLFCYFYFFFFNN